MDFYQNLTGGEGHDQLIRTTKRPPFSRASR